MWRYTLLILILFTHGALLLQVQAVTQILDYEELAAIRSQPKSQEYLSIVWRGNKVIKQQPVAVTDKTVCHSGNKHKYESLSIYWWPDPSNPGGPYIARDGEFNPEYKMYDYPKLLRLKDDLIACSKAYFLTGDDRYYDFFCQQLDTWFIDDSTYMTPDFDYCQIIPGRNDGKGNPQGLVDAYNFNAVIDAVVLVNEVKSIGRRRLKAVKNWMKSFAFWMETSHNGQVASKYNNNQAIAYETTLYNIYMFTSRKSRAKEHALTCIKHIKAQIDDDGKQPQELRRAKPLTYVKFNLEHIEYFLSKCSPRMIDAETSEKVVKARQFAEAMKSEK